MTNILHFHGVVRDDSSSVDTNSEASGDPDDPGGSDGNLIGKNLSKLVLLSAFAKGCLKFGRSVELGSSSGVKGASKIGSKAGTSKRSVEALPSSRFEGGNDEILLSSHSQGASNIGSKIGTSKRSVETLPSPRSEDVILSSPSLKAFTFKDLKNATRNFGPDSFLGEGGFGYVFKGWLDEDTLAASRPGSGMVVAVKKLKPESFQGHNEWLAEVNYLGCFLHQNLIRLIGYCLEDENRLLVYEFMPKGSLDNHLFRRAGANTLPWEVRIKVAIGAARVLSFLHNLEMQVIHRNISTSNILLDVEFNPKLSDFGLARAGPTGDATHVSTRVVGTYGYAAPEYLATGRLSAKSDVYSFGVVMLELLSGRRAVDRTRAHGEQNLVEWAKHYLGDQRELFRVMDRRLEAQYSEKGARMAAALALRCLSNDAKVRPTMAEALTVLERISDANHATKQSK